MALAACASACGDRLDIGRDVPTGDEPDAAAETPALPNAPPSPASPVERAWRAVSPRPTSSALRGSWSTGRDLWLVGEGGAIVHEDGVAAKLAFQGPLSQVYDAVWSSGPDDVWVAGEKQLLHFDGARWMDDFSIAGANCLWGSGKSDVWAGGVKGGLFHWDGKAWKASSEAGGFIVDLMGTSASDVWAVGLDGGVQHFDGVRWSRSRWSDGAEAKYGTHLFAVWPVRPGEAWAAYERWDQEATQWRTGFVHYDGVAWSVTKEVESRSPRSRRGRRAWGFGADRVFFLGGPFAAESGADVLYAWDGAAWTEHEAPRDIHGGTISGRDGQLVAAGERGRVMRAAPAGLSWSELFPGLRDDLVATSASVDGALWAITARAAFRWDGASRAWEEIASVAAPGALYAISAQSAREAFVEYYAPKTVPSGGAYYDWKILRVDGGGTHAMIEETGGGTFTRSPLWSDGAGHTWTTALGKAYRWDGASWVDMGSPPFALYASGISGTGERDVWFSGCNQLAFSSDAVVARWDGEALREVARFPGECTDPNILGEAQPRVLATGPNDVWLTTSPVRRFDGSVWTTLPTDRRMGAIWGSGPNDVWMALDAPIGLYPDVRPPATTPLRHWDGTTLKADAFASLESIAAITGTAAAGTWAVGTTGTTLRLETTSDNPLPR